MSCEIKDRLTSQIKNIVVNKATSYNTTQKDKVLIPVAPKSKFYGGKEQALRVAQATIKRVEKEFDPKTWGQVVSLDLSLKDFIGVNIHPTGKLIAAYEQKEGGQLQLFSLPEQVNYNFKAIAKITQNLAKVKLWWNKVQSPPVFWEKLQKDLGIPKDQIELLRNSEGKNIEEKLIDFTAKYGFSVKVKTAIGAKPPGGAIPEYLEDSELEERYYRQHSAVGNNSQYYSNLTVPGGTNYTENEIATPAITPSIKGHAQFATDNGIGWFRSDDKSLSEKNTGKTKEYYDENYNRITKEEHLKKYPLISTEISTKTRRILEVQSDLFQKGRNAKELVKNDKFFDKNKPDNTFLNPSDYDSHEEFLEANSKFQDNNQRENNSSENQFLQLLNKDNNWVTFFVKSIIQDSAKKGYEKVLFPSGNSAMKIEGLSTVENYKKEKEDRLKQLNNEIAEYKKHEEEANDEDNFYQNLNSLQREKAQVEAELKRIETEGFGALQPIYNFYENTVANLLKKNYSVKKVTDEYGNTWNELTITPEHQDAILLNIGQPTASPEVIDVARRALAKMGVSIVDVNKLFTPQGLPANAVLQISKEFGAVVKVVQGQEAAIPEEAVHMLIRLLKGTPLWDTLMKNIEETSSWKNLDAQYKEAYEGSIDLLKEEAAGKEVVSHLQKELDKERSNKIKLILNKIVNWLKNLFKNVDPKEFETEVTNAYAEAAGMIVRGEVPEMRNLEEGELYSLADGTVEVSERDVKRLQTGTGKKAFLWEEAPKRGQQIQLTANGQFTGIYINVTTVKKMKLSALNSKTKEIVAGDLGYRSWAAFEEMAEGLPNDHAVKKSLQGEGYVYRIDFEPLKLELPKIVPDVPTNQYIIEELNAIEILKKQKRAGFPDHNLIIDRKIEKKQEDIKKLKERGNTKWLLSIAEREIAEIKNEMLTFTQKDTKAKFFFLNNAFQSVENWKALPKVLTWPAGSEEGRKTKELGGEALELEEKLFGLLQAAVADEMKVARPDWLDMLLPVGDEGWISRMGVSANSMKIPLLQKLSDFLAQTNYKVVDATEKDVKELIAPATAKVKAFAQTKGIADVNKVFRQMKDGQWTGNYITPIKQEFWDRRREAFKKGDTVWLEKNTKRVLKPATYRSGDTTAELMIEKVRKENGEDISMYEWYRRQIEAAETPEQYQEWVKENDPKKLKYGEKSKYVEYEPTDEWKDKEFEKLAPELKEYWEFFTSYITYRRGIMPGQKGIPRNFLPEVQASILSDVLKDSLNMFSLGEKAMNMLTEKLESPYIYGALDPITKTQMMEIPGQRMLQNRIPTEEKSDDIDGVMRVFAQISYAYEYKNHIAPVVLAARSIFDNRVLQKEETAGGVQKQAMIKEDGKIIGARLVNVVNAHPQASAHLDFLIDYMLYDIKKQPGSGGLEIATDAGPRVLTFRQLADMSVRYTRLVGMGGNYIAATTNVITGTVNNFTYAEGNDEFGVPELMDSYLYLLRNIFTRDNNKLGKIMKNFRILGDVKDTSYHDATGKVIEKVESLAYGLQSIGEYFNQGAVAGAIMRKKKIKDLQGNEHSLWDAFDEEGNFRKEFGEMYDNLSPEKWELAKDIKLTNARISGNYDPDRPVEGKKYIAGRIVLLFRTWLPELVAERFASERAYNGGIRKGRYRSLGAYFEEENKLKGLGTLGADVAKELIHQFSFYQADFKRFEGLRDIDKINMRRFVAEIKFFIITGTLFLIMKSLDDDEDDKTINAALRFWGSQAYRVNSDLSLFLIPSEQHRLFQNIFPPLRTVENVQKLGGDLLSIALGGEDEISTGQYAHQSRLWRDTKKLIPGLKTYQTTVDLLKEDLE